MKRVAKWPLIVVVLLAALAPSQTRARTCGGTERWQVKVGTDSGVGNVDLTTQIPMVVSDMLQLHQPQRPPKGDNDTRLAEETHVYVVTGHLIKFKLETGASGDQDYHMVISDDTLNFTDDHAGQPPGHSLVAEIPNPDCTAGKRGDPSVQSRFIDVIRASRQKLESQFPSIGQAGAFNDAGGIAVRIVGVGFFDFPHHQVGRASNNVEIHPVLDISFNPRAGTPVMQSTDKDASARKDFRNPHGNTNQGASGAPDKNSQPNKPAGSESQPPLVASSVKCAIKLPEKGDQFAAKWLDLARNCQNSSEDNSDKNPTAGLKNKLFLSISLSSGKLMAADKMPAKFEDLRLMINGVEIPDAKLSWEASDDTTAVLSTQLARTESSEAAWNELLAQKLRKHSVPVTVTDASKKPLDSGAYFNLQVMHFGWFTWILLVILLMLVIILFTNDRLKEMLRDDGPYKNQGNAGTRAAYSLSRVQMFYWFGITVVCYVLIWLITGDRDTINNDVLALMGISAGTFLGAASIDASKKSQAQSQLPDAAAKLNQTQATAAAITATRGAADPAAVATAQAVTSQQQALVQLNDRTLADYNEDFLTDILSDEDGPSFHRFQMFAWSLVLGVIFVASVIQTLSMPAFGNTLLGLMGISGGTYLGFKFPEQKTK
jgi:hypothetical protein